jgi:mannosyl-oligosaccharide glucosidase
LKTTVVFSIASEAQGLAALEVQGDEAKLRDLKGMEGDVVVNGDSPSLGAFKITITKGKGNHPTHSHPSEDEKPLDRTLVSSQTYPSHVLWQTKQILFTQMKTSIDAYIQKYGEDNIPPPFQLYTVTSDAGVGNQHMVQKVFEGGFEFDVLFSSFAAGKDMSSEDITEGIKKITSKFDKRFETIFKPQAPFNSEKYLEFSKSLFSNLMGGIGYFRGDWKVDRSEAPEYDEDNEGFWEEAAEARARAIPQLAGPSELFTSIPSRPFFPRGFLWDEGFHLMPIIDWDVDLTLEIVKSWFNLIDEDGWIAREQILGEEARSKVPAEFQVQYPNYANPPTLFFILTEFVEKLSKSNPTDGHSLLLSNETASQYLSEMYPLLKRHYEWFRRTQQGDIKSYDRVAFSTKEGYRWRGRTPRHILTSGLDDYPRAQPPHPGELHVDAISWVGMMAKSLQRVAEFIGEKDDAARLAKQHEAILKNIDNLHWDQRQGVFCDSTIDQFEEDVHVCHKGYISLFPFLLGLMDRDSPKIGKLLDVITDGEELWSDHGIRSLSKRSEFYGTDENYWRSPVWMNINYLALSRLLVSPRRAHATPLSC